MYAEVSDARRFAQSEWNQLRRCKARTQRPRSELVQIEIAGVMGMRIKVPALRVADVYAAQEEAPGHQGRSVLYCCRC